MHRVISVTVLLIAISFGAVWIQAADPCEVGTWRTISGTPRYGHSAVWTGEEMIVWGGKNAQNEWVNTGERYNPVTGVRVGTSTIGAPSPRYKPAVVWTGTHMLVWGGSISTGSYSWTRYNDGALYDPATDTWTPMSQIDAPIPRRRFAYGWSGTQLLVHGGYGDPSSTPPPEGYDFCEPTLLDTHLYDPATDTWESSTHGPQVGEHAAIWTGTEFMIAGGYRSINNSAISGYCDDWLLPDVVAQTFDPSTGVWTDEVEYEDNFPVILEPVLLQDDGQVFVFGGGINGDFPIRFDPSTRSWDPITPSGFSHFNVTWADGVVYLWYGPTEAAIWNPSNDDWTPMSATGAPAGRGAHTLVWTGEEMIVWGGSSSMGSIVYSGGGAFRSNDPDHDGLVGPCDLCPDGDVGFDSDGDGLGDPCDNCPAEPNPFQRDSDADLVGDSCDACVLDADNDIDGDGWCANDDNCPYDANVDQVDTDRDLAGDACDHCPTVFSMANLDSDADGVGDVCDNCSSVANATQANNDRELVRQWAATATASSEWTETDWSADQATGPPEMNACESIETNWTPLEGGSVAEWLELGYPASTQAIGVDVVNSGVQNGFVQSVELIDSGGGRHTIWDDTDPSTCGEILSLRWNQTTYDVSSVVVHTQVDEWEEIDAVELLGVGAPQNDLFGNACDVCPFVNDPSQADSDADGAGDLCDCAPTDATARQPSEVTLLSVSSPAPGISRLTWSPTAGADQFVVRRGLLSTLDVGSYGDCITSPGTTSDPFDDADLPPAGDGFAYLMQGWDFVCGLGTLGPASNGSERIQLTPDACF